MIQQQMGNKQLYKDAQDTLQKHSLLVCCSCNRAFSPSDKPFMICQNQHNSCKFCLPLPKCPICKEHTFINPSLNILLDLIFKQLRQQNLKKGQERVDINNINKHQFRDELSKAEFNFKSPSVQVNKTSLHLRQRSLPKLQKYDQSTFKRIQLLQKQSSIIKKESGFNQYLQSNQSAKALDEEANSIFMRNIGQKQISILTILDLHLNRLRRIPPLLQDCSLLTQLSLNKNAIRNIDHLQKLTRLEYLSLSDNQIEQIKNLQMLNNLKKLYLNFNKLTRIDGLDRLKQIQFLGLSYNRITIIRGLDYLLQLKWLSLEGNLLQKLEKISQLLNLETLLLSNNQLTSLEGIQSLVSLKKVSIQNNLIEDFNSILSLKLKEIKAEGNPSFFKQPAKIQESGYGSLRTNVRNQQAKNVYKKNIDRKIGNFQKNAVTAITQANDCQIY